MFSAIVRLRGPYLRLLAFVLIALPALAQPAPALQQMADAERAFAARATVVGWKQAFLEYFADSASRPCRTTVGIDRLPTPIAIELKCMAVVNS